MESNLLRTAADLTPAEFARGYPAYEETRKLDALRRTEYGYLDEHGQVYLTTPAPALRRGRSTARTRNGCVAGCSATRTR